MHGSLSPPLAPPIKKQRAGSTPVNDNLSMKTGQALAGRRAELDRLNAVRTAQNASGASLMAKAQIQLNGPPTGGRGAPNPPMPNQSGVARVRHSDIFPTVPKQQHQQYAPALKAPPQGLPITSDPPRAGPPRGPQPPVARRLDVTFADTPKPRDSRSKSAPPSRPPPPPATPHVSEAPEPRGHVTRPYPVTPGARGPPPPPPGRTPGPPAAKSPSVAGAGRTPFPKAAVARPAPTPYPKAAAISAPTAPTPYAAAPAATAAPPTTGRRDMLRSMRENVDTPPKGAVVLPITGGGGHVKSPVSPELRMQKELLKAQTEKKDAFAQVARMGGEMEKLRAEQTQSEQKLVAVLQMADAEGDTVAVEWARKHVRGKHVGFLSPMANVLKSPSASLSVTRAMTPLAMSHHTTPWKRAATPYPKQKKGANGASVEKEFLVEAANCAEFEFVVEGLASYMIRRPFGLAEEKDFWCSSGQKNTKMYERSADVCDASTLEVAAVVEADGSVLSLHGEAMVRHQTNNGISKDHGNVNDRDKPLGSIMYIDSDANDKEYLLDEVFEGAVAARSHYCSSLVVAAGAIRSQRASQPPALVPEQAPPMLGSPQAAAIGPDKVETSEICVGTEDLPFPAPGAKAASANGTAPKPAEKPVKKPKSAPPPPEENTDILSVFINMFFGTIASVLWTIFVRTPLNILATAFYMLIGGMLLSLMWLYLADDNGAGNMGAIMDSTYNLPGIF